jgi:Flp pilus assembly protein TadD
MLTLLLGLLGRSDEARDNVRAAESLFPQNPLYAVIQAQLFALQDDAPRAAQQLEKVRPRLSARQMEAARAVVELCGQFPALARGVEGDITNDPNTSCLGAVFRLTTALTRARASLSQPGGDLYLPLHPVLWEVSAESPGFASLAMLGNRSAYDRLGRVAEVHPDGLVYLIQGVALGKADTPERWAAAEKAFSRAAETPSVFPIRRAALYAAAAAEWVLSREGPPGSRPAMQRRAQENMRKLMALGVRPEQATLLLVIALAANDVHAAHYVLGEWERQAPRDRNLHAWRIRAAFRCGEFGRAVELIDQAVRADPREAATWEKMRGEAAARLRQLAEAAGGR